MWSSGRTNDLGVIIGADGRPLPTEILRRATRRTGRQQSSAAPRGDHVARPGADLRDAADATQAAEFTTSFVRGCETVKDNRLLPRGWTKAGPGPALTGRFLEATYPDPDDAGDPRYADGSGSDEVTYRIARAGGRGHGRPDGAGDALLPGPPALLLRNLFETGPRRPGDPEAARPRAAGSDLKGTPIAGWKLRVASAQCDPRTRPHRKPRGGDRRGP